jgi:alcohol dehydrogenase class IV
MTETAARAHESARRSRGRVSKFLMLDIPRGLRDVDVDPADFDRFARTALRDAYIATNPRPVTEDDVRRICVAAY